MNKIKMEFNNVDEVLERDVIGFGNSGRINIPKKHVGKKAKITIFKKEEIENLKKILKSQEKEVGVNKKVS